MSRKYNAYFTHAQGRRIKSKNQFAFNVVGKDVGEALEFVNDFAKRNGYEIDNYIVRRKANPNGNLDWGRYDFIITK